MAVFNRNMAKLVSAANFAKHAAMLTPFHIAYHVTDLDAARHFYGDILGCTEGRSTESWVDFDFFGHQISLHLGQPFQTTRTGKVGDHLVPMPHLGLVMAYDVWRILADRLQRSEIDWIIPPSVRFEGDPGEQWTMFFEDPSGNPLEIKGFKSLDGVFAT